MTLYETIADAYKDSPTFNKLVDDLTAVFEAKRLADLAAEQIPTRPRLVDSIKPPQESLNFEDMLEGIE